MLISAAGCSGPAGGTAPLREPLRLAAASDLQGALPVLVREFQRENAGVKVETAFGASGRLAEQIKAGAPFDLFLAANERFVGDLAAANVVKSGSVRPYAVGSLVLAVRTDATAPVESLSDLVRPEVKKVAIANPDTAPYGAAARQALKNAGLWDKAEPKLVLADSVRQAFQFVETGNADVALVGRALTVGSPVRVVAVDPGLYDPIVQGLGVVAASKRGADAEAFARFLTGPKGQAVLKSFGFNLPGPAAP